MILSAVKDVKPTSAEGWLASLDLRLQNINGKTCLIPKKRIGPLTVQRPFYPEADVCHVYVLHPPGGVVGGDQLKLEIDAGPDARGLITTPGASKFYRSGGKTAALEQNIHVSKSAVLEFLPQESIYFPASKLSAKFVVSLEQGARYAGWEIHSFGLPANNQDFDSGQVLLNTELRVDGKLLLHDKLKVDAIEQQRTCGLQGHRVYGSFIVYSKNINKALLDSLQAQSIETGLSGVSRVEPDLLVARYLGDSTEHALRYFKMLWQILRPVALGMEACAPRIWNT